MVENLITNDFSTKFVRKYNKRFFLKPKGPLNMHGSIHVDSHKMLYFGINTYNKYILMELTETRNSKWLDT